MVQFEGTGPVCSPALLTPGPGIFHDYQAASARSSKSHDIDRMWGGPADICIPVAKEQAGLG